MRSRGRAPFLFIQNTRVAQKTARSHSKVASIDRHQFTPTLLSTRVPRQISHHSPKQSLRAKCSITVTAIILTPAPGHGKSIKRPEAQETRRLARLIAFLATPCTPCLGFLLMSKLTILPKQCLRAKLSTTVSAILLTPAPGRKKRIPRPHAQIIRLLAGLLSFAPRSPQVTPRTILQRSDFPCPPCSVPSLSLPLPFHLVGIYPHAPCSAHHSNHARLSHQMPPLVPGDSGRRPLSPHLKISYVFSIFQNRCSASHLLTQRGSDPTDQMSPPESSSWTRLAADIGDERSTCHAQTRLKLPQKRNGRIAIS